MWSLARVLERVGDRDAARSRYEEALRLQPTFRYAHASLASLLDASGETPDALRHSIDAVRHGSRDAQSFGRIAGLLRSASGAQTPEWDEVRGRAVDELEALIGKYDAAPDLLLGVCSIGRAFVPSRLDVDRALAHARAAVDSGIERQSLLHGWLADVELRAGNGREAVVALEAGLRNPHALRALEGQLAETRRAVRPLLPTLGSIDAALAERDAAIVLPADASWRFFRGREEPPAGWREPDFDDTDWESGVSGLGYGDGDDATVLLDMQGGYTSVYARIRFEVDEAALFESFVLDVSIDDGFVAWLNGVEVGRVRAGPPGEPVPHEARADTAVNDAEAVRLPIHRSGVRSGENVLAITGLNSALDSSDFSLAPSVLALPPLSPELRERLRSDARASAPSKSSGNDSLELYLEARLSELDADLAAAAERFETLVARTASWPVPRPIEPVLGLARVLEAAGKAGEAEEALRHALSIGIEDRPVWEAWFKSCLVALKLDAAATRSRLPRVGPRRERHDAAVVDSTDIAWLLDTLARGETIRIDCGAEDDADVAPGWNRDSFALGGNTAGKVVLDVFGTEDDGLYQSGRVFPSGQALPAGYRVPLPPGRYRVALHFAAVHWLEDRRAFDIRLEGAPVEEGFDLGAAPFRTAIVKGFETDVTDGFLDLELVLRNGVPRISALEILVIGGGPFRG